MKLYTKLSLGIGIPFGLLTGSTYPFVLSAVSREDFSIIETLFVGTFFGLVMGVFFGLSMSSIMVAHHRRKTRWIPTQDGDLVSPIQSKTATVGMPPANLFTLCLQSVEEQGARVTRQERAHGLIQAVTGSNWKDGWGEELILSLADDGEGGSNLIISSKPRLMTVVLDNGKGYENVTNLIQSIGQKSLDHNK